MGMCTSVCAGIGWVGGIRGWGSVGGAGVFAGLCDDFCVGVEGRRVRWCGCLFLCAGMQGYRIFCEYVCASVWNSKRAEVCSDVQGCRSVGVRAGFFVVMCGGVCVQV